MEKIVPKGIHNILPLPPMQEGMLFHYLKDPRSGLYFEQLSLEIGGGINVDIFEKAWNAVIQANEMLRTVFRWEKLEKPSQIILKEHPCEIRFHDFSNMDDVQKETALAKVKTDDRDEYFDLNRVPFRVTLCKLAETQYEMIVSNHHILYDGWSNGIILKEFFNAYHVLSKGEQALQLSVKTSLKEYIKWLQSRDKNKQEYFWRNYLDGFETVTELPIKRKNEEATGMGDYAIILGEDIQSKLDIFVKNNRITLASIFYTAWGILLQRYSSSEDILFGTTVSGRSANFKGIEDMVGLFINTIPLRLNTYPGETIIDVISRTDQVLREREEFEHTPLVDIQGYSSLDGSGSLFDTILVIENYPLDNNLVPEDSLLAIQSYSMVETTHYDLTVGIIMPFKGIEIKFSFKQELFDKETIENLAGHFKTIIQKMIAQPEIVLSQLEIISIEEKNRILNEFNNTAAEYPRDKTIHQLFAEQALKTPDYIAIVGNADVEEKKRRREEEKRDGMHLSYHELNEQSDKLAGILIEKGVLPDSIVGIMMERSVEMIIGILGILKSGGAYLPIDPDYPQERIEYMLKDSNAKVLIINKSEIRNPKSRVQTNPNDQKINGQNKNFEDLMVLDFENLDFEFVSNFVLRASNLISSNLAYIIYTSGSTGKPKGVMIDHQSVVNLLFAMQNKYPFTFSDTYLLKTSYTFDVSVTELFGWYMGGGSLAILETNGEKDPDAILNWIHLHHVTHINFVPSMFNAFLDFVIEKNRGWLRNLKYIFLAGEALLPVQVKKFFDLNTSIELKNIYGPTEGTVYSSQYSLFDCNKMSIPIGKPLPNIELYILNKYDHLQPMGIAGELYIGGMGVARGYLNNPELTNKQFKSKNEKLKSKNGSGAFRANFHRSSFITHHSKLYRTGDLCKWLADGNIEFLGRIDYQIKIRGFRIELGEIENRLLKHPEIKEAFVLSRDEGNEGKYLCAYIVAARVLDTLELREYLFKELPTYMIPSYFIQLDYLPLNRNGKVERASLPEPIKDRFLSEKTYAAPQSDVEKIVADIWKQVLKIDKVGIHDNFFDVGGNSFYIIRLSSKLKDAFKKEISVTTLFNYPTINTQARFLSEQESDSAGSPIYAAGGKLGLDVAVIGMAGRFPGAKNIEEFWDNIKRGIESITFFTDEELEKMKVDLELINNPNYVKAKGVLENMEYFDSLFFDYSAREAHLMDPQMRILHECVWEALENAGYVPGYSNNSIGLYVGSLFNAQWMQQLDRQINTHSDLMAMGSLNDRDFLATRISYKLNLKGPAVTVQSACSTSLVAIDMACQALQGDRCHIALAGGCSLTLQDRTGYLYEEGMVRSPDGHCRPFDAEAKGTVGGNGVGIVVLKNLKKAILDKDNIRAVIKGSSINNDGARKVGYTAPSIQGQVEVIRSAMNASGIAPETITYLETHGTGTILGDPVEIEALKQAFNTNKRKFCGIGAVKANIGHLDAAAGAAGFIKTVLAMENRMIPPLINFKNPNPQIDFENSPFYINTQLKEWENNIYPLRAGVSSFGIGGTNAHVILEKWTGNKNRDLTERKREYQLILLSAKTESALEKMTFNLVEYLKKYPHINLADVAYTLQVGRENFQFRRMALCSGIDDVIESLLDTKAGKVNTSKVENSKPQLVFMFPGLGTQYVNMGRELYEKEPYFRQEMDRCFKILRSLTDENIKEILYPNDFMFSASKNDPITEDHRSVTSNKINQTEIAQIVIFIFEYTLAKLMIELGIRPKAMIGYSFGEYIAACIAGVFSLEDALKLVVARGQLMKKIPTGVMMNVPLPRETLIPLLEEDISIAIDNGPSCVISGPGNAVDAFEEKMKKMRCICLRLPVIHAVHSTMMEPVLEEFKVELSRVSLNRPQIPYISNVTGQWIKDQEATDPGYWLTHLRETVRFADGLKELLKEPGSLFLEVGPGHELSSLLVRHLGKNLDQPVLNLVRHPDRDVSDVYFLLNKIGFIWLKGLKVDWSKFYSGERQRLSLPTYPFEGKRYWSKEDNEKDIPRPSVEASKIKKKNIGDWFYLPQWERSHLLPLASHRFEIPLQSCLLIFVDESGFSSRLVEELRQFCEAQKDLKLITVTIGAAFRKTSSFTFEINPQQREGYDALLAEFRILNRVPVIIIHLWSITANEEEKEVSCREKINEAQEKGLYSLLYLAQAIILHEFSENIKVNIVSTNIHEVTGEELLDPQKAPLLGLAKVIPQEYGNITCRCIDIELPHPGSSKEKRLIGKLVEEFVTNSPGAVIAYRMNHRWVQIFKSVHIELVDKYKDIFGPVKNGVYLIIGGLGNIGFTLAKYLAKNFKTNLILTGLTALPPRSQWNTFQNSKNEEKEDIFAGQIRKIRRIMELEESGAEVLYFDCDTADHEQMQKIITCAEERFGSINGVIHAAVSPAGEWFKAINELNKNEILKQFRPKIYGVLTLDKIFRHRTLDFCFIISSPSSILGGLGFGAYAAANAFLDAFVYKSNRRNAIPWITVNWGDWLFEEEMHGNVPLKNPLHYLLMTPEEGVTTFRFILNSLNGLVNQVVISAVDLQNRINQWVRFQHTGETGKQIETGNETTGIGNQKTESSSYTRHPRPNLMYPYEAPVSGMEKMLTGIWETYFGLEKVGILDNFFDLGATSMDIIQLNSRLRAVLKRNITVTEFFAYPTIKLLANHLGEEPEKEKINHGKEKFQRVEELKKGRQNIQERRQIRQSVKA